MPIARVPRSRQRRIFGATQLRLNEALEREAERGEERLSRLFGRLLPFAREIERRFEVSERALDLAEQDEQPRPSVLVSQIVGALASGRRARHVLLACESVQIQRSASAMSGWSRTRTFAASPGVPAPARRSRPRSAPEQRLRREARQERVRGKRLVADLGRKRECDVRVLERLLESLEHPDAARREPLMRKRERLTVVVGGLLQT